MQFLITFFGLKYGARDHGLFSQKFIYLDLMQESIPMLFLFRHPIFSTDGEG